MPQSLLQRITTNCTWFIHYRMQMLPRPEHIECICGTEFISAKTCASIAIANIHIANSRILLARDAEEAKKNIKPNRSY